MKREDVTYQNRPYGGTVTFKQPNNAGPIVLTGTWALNIYKNGQAVPFVVGTVANGKIAVNAAAGIVTRTFPKTDFANVEGYGSAEFVRTDIDARPLVVWPIRFVKEGTAFIDKFNSDLVVYGNDVVVLVEGTTLQTIADAVHVDAAAAQASAAAAAASATLAAANNTALNAGATGLKLIAAAKPKDARAVLGNARTFSEPVIDPAVVLKMPIPKSGFGNDFPSGQLSLSGSITASFNGGPGLISCSLYTTTYGGAGTSFQVRGTEYVLNQGINGGATQDKGASETIALFEAAEFQPASVLYDGRNPIFTGGYTNYSGLQYVTSVTAPVEVWKPSPDEINVTGRFAMWVDPKYIVTNDGYANGASNNALADWRGQTRHKLGNMGTDANPIVIWNAKVLDIAILPDRRKTMDHIDADTMYSPDTFLTKYYKFDPRTNVQTQTFAKRSDALNIAGVAQLGANYSLSFIVAGVNFDGHIIAANEVYALPYQTIIGDRDLWIANASGLPTRYPSFVEQVVVTYSASGNAGTLWTYNGVNVWQKFINYHADWTIMTNTAGTFALGIACPQIPLSNEVGALAGSGTTITRFPSVGVMGYEVWFRPGTVHPDIAHLYKIFKFIGTPAEVIASMQLFWVLLAKIMSPNVFDWIYYRDNTPGIATWPIDQVRGHYFWYGAATSAPAKAGFTFALKPPGMSYFDYRLSLA
jgi:hypothetical protein